MGRCATVRGNMLAVARRLERTVRAVEICDFDHPKLLHEYHLFGHPDACDFWQGRLVVPAGYQGLLLEGAAIP